MKNIFSFTRALQRNLENKYENKKLNYITPLSGTFLCSLWMFIIFQVCLSQSDMYNYGMDSQPFGGGAYWNQPPAFPMFGAMNPLAMSPYIRRSNFVANPVRPPIWPKPTTTFDMPQKTSDDYTDDQYNSGDVRSPPTLR